MAPRKLTSALNSPHKQRPSRFPASPIQVSTPPVRIIGVGARHKGGFRLDR